MSEQAIARRMEKTMYPVWMKALDKILADRDIESFRNFLPLLDYLAPADRSRAEDYIRQYAARAEAQ